MSAYEEAMMLHSRGYIGVSNKYRIVVRIDRADWKEILAGKLLRSVADLYVRDRDGRPTQSTGRWGEFYASTYSSQKIEGISTEVYSQLKKIWAATGGYLEYVE